MRFRTTSHSSWAIESIEKDNDEQETTYSNQMYFNIHEPPCLGDLKCIIALDIYPGNHTTGNPFSDLGSQIPDDLSRS